jgi:hypothetical protein
MAYALVTNAAKRSLWPEATTATTTGVNTSGATLIVLYVGTFTQPTATPTDSKSNTWTAVAAERSTGSPTTYERWWYCENPSVGASHTFSHIVSNGRPVIGMLAFSGMVSPSFDQENWLATSSSTTGQTGSLSPADGSGLALAGVVSAYAGPSSINSSFTTADLLGNGYGVNGIGTAYLISPGTGALNPTWTMDASATTILAGITTWKQTGGGGGGTTWGPWVAGSQQWNRIVVPY